MPWKSTPCGQEWEEPKEDEAIEVEEDSIFTPQPAPIQLPEEAELA